ncbi:MAG: hypothetical protein QOG53_2491 [Frankiales bacterium]|jgi:predicted GNAT family acetyltransferase|nr:hypothetical protein [Frankiales bacterium]
MNVQVTDDVEVFAAAVTPFLELDPVRCSVPLTVIATVRSGLVDVGTYSWVEDDNSDVVGTASWTPPYELLLSPMPEAAAVAVADAWASRVTDFRGVVGPREVVDRCAQRLSEHTHGRCEQRMAERLFRLDAVIDPPLPAGRPGQATHDDTDLAVAWFGAFFDEAGVVRGDETVRDVRARIDDGRLHLWWVNDGPVSLVAHSVSVAGVTRVGPVYTPPEERGRGYARALVASVSKGRLDAGDQACCLFTDVANPVSNAIYQQVGYRPVGDYARIDLVTK